MGKRNIKLNKINDMQMTFRQVSGTWRRVDSQEPFPPTLAECIKNLNIIVDDDAQFCRIIRYYNKISQTITYCAYGGTITICINTYKEQ